MIRDEYNGGPSVRSLISSRDFESSRKLDDIVRVSRRKLR